MKLESISRLGLLCAALVIFLGPAEGQDSGQQSSVRIKNDLAGSSGSEDKIQRGRPDPFAPLREAPKVKPAPEKKEEVKPPVENAAASTQAVPLLGGIMWSSHRPVAVVNGTLVGIEEEVDGWLVLEIHRDRILLEYSGRKEVVKIQAPLLKKKSRRVAPRELENEHAD